MRRNKLPVHGVPIQAVDLERVGIKVKLSEPFKLRSTDIDGYYARSLRAIGEDLTELFPEKMAIEYQGEDFVVCGHCAKSRLEARAPKPERTGLKELLTRDLTLRPQETKSGSVPFTRVYAPADIARLNQAGISRRSGVKKLPDIHSLGESLRTIGRIIEADQGRLIRIAKDARQVNFEYVNGVGATCKHEISRLDLYNLQKSYYDNRGETHDETNPRGAFRLKK